MQVVCLEDEAFYALIREVVNRIKAEQKTEGDRWIGGDEAMRMLRISSKTTLQKLRNEGKIRYSQPHKKSAVLYDVHSIEEYLEKNAKNVF